MTICNETSKLLGNEKYRQISEDILKYHNLFYGGGNMTNSNKSYSTLSTGNEVLDEMLNGGYKIGTLTEISGPTDTGKTLLALKAIKELQTRDNNKLTVYIDASRSFKLEYTEEHELDTDGIILIQPESIEKLVVMLSEVVKPCIEDIGLIVIDSLADLTTNKEQESNLIANTDRHRSIVIKALLTRIANLVRNSETCAIILNQDRTNFEDEIASTVSSSERWIKMTCDARLRLSLDEEGDPCVEVSFKNKLTK